MYIIKCEIVGTRRVHCRAASAFKGVVRLQLHAKFDKLKKDHTEEKKRLEELRKKIEDDTIELNRRKQQTAQAHHTLTLGKSKKK